MKSIGIDTETTGLDFEKDNITELAAVYRDGNYESVFHEYIKYDSYTEGYDEVAKITGLTPELLSEKGRPAGEVYKLFIDWISGFIDRYDKEDKAVLIGYNVNFDNQFLRKFFEKHNDFYYGSWFYNCRVDVMSMVAQGMVQERIEPLKNYKLETVCEHFNIEIDAHSAISDVMATLKLFEVLK